MHIEESKARGSWLPGRNWAVFVLVMIGLLWVVHAAAFFPHEYAHSFVAWVLGWKKNPLALDYGGTGAGNLLLQVDIDENVDYDPIFAAGRGVQAAMIALAGVVLGNGLTYCSPWWIIVVPGVPFFIAAVHFVLRFAPDALRWIFPDSPGRRVVMVVLSSLALFGFYCGMVGWSG